MLLVGQHCLLYGLCVFDAVGDVVGLDGDLFVAEFEFLEGVGEFLRLFFKAFVLLG